MTAVPMSHLPASPVRNIQIHHSQVLMAISTNSKSSLGELSTPELTSLGDQTRASASASRSLYRRLEGEGEDEFGEDDPRDYARCNVDSEEQEAGVVLYMQFGGAPSLEAAYLRAQPNRPTQPMETNMIPDASPSLLPLTAVGPDRRMMEKVEKKDPGQRANVVKIDDAVTRSYKSDPKERLSSFRNCAPVQLEQLRVTEALATVMDVEKATNRPYCVVITLLGRYIELRRSLLRGVQHLSYFQHARLTDPPIKSLKRMYETTVFLGAEIPDVLPTVASDPYFRDSQWKLRPPLTDRVESENTQHHYNQRLQGAPGVIIQEIPPDLGGLLANEGKNREKNGNWVLGQNRSYNFHFVKNDQFLLVSLRKLIGSLWSHRLEMHNKFTVLEVVPKHTDRNPESDVSVGCEISARTAQTPHAKAAQFDLIVGKLAKGRMWMWTLGLWGNYGTHQYELAAASP
ncbi:hypothetical protein EDD16DRAFT_1522556 [Pisolithus croceorrhizus]|nr:hypothetical protein EDD16DRAFT_1522556 [Pisolithus croceorrhizus]